MPLKPDSTYVIAEAGSCHMGDFNAATRLVEAAADSGANACKFQLFKAADILNNPDGFDFRLEMNPDWIVQLSDLCQREYHIDFLCTPFAPWAVEALTPYVWAWKIGSFEWNRNDIWKAVRATRKPIIASMGRCDTLIADYRLYCVSKYPAPISDVYLPTFGPDERYDGFSDHTTSTMIPAIAVARGATIIEKHIRLDSTPTDCPDYPHSLTPDRFTEMVSAIRIAEEVCCRPRPPYQEPFPYPNRRE